MHRANSNGIDKEILLSLNATLDRIVGCKAKRFGEYVTFLKKDKTLATSNPFETITQPMMQIGEITRGVCELFSVLFGKQKSLIKVVLAVVKDNKIIELPLYFPQDESPRIDIKLLNKPNSTIMTALNAKKMVIIESTRKELQKGRKSKFVDSDGNESDCSLICFPIYHEPTTSFPFVLSIHSDEAGVFKKEFSELYGFLLGRFEHRLSLEYSLMKIKEEVSSRG